MRPKKKYGQHFLEAAWADKLVAAINPQPEDRFVEIGPGPGALTLRLAPRVARLTAIELDADMVAALQPRLPANATVVHSDFLSSISRRSPPSGRFVSRATFPTTCRRPSCSRCWMRTERWEDRRCDPDGAARGRRSNRRVPGTGEYGVLSIFMQLHADVRLLLALPPGAFRPRPEGTFCRR